MGTNYYIKFKVKDRISSWSITRCHIGKSVGGPVSLFNIKDTARFFMSVLIRMKENNYTNIYNFDKIYNSFVKLNSQLQYNQDPTNISKLKQYLITLWECLGDSYYCEDEDEEVVNFKDVLDFLFSKHNKVNQAENPEALWFIGGFHCVRTDDFS